MIYFRYYFTYALLLSILSVTLPQELQADTDQLQFKWAVFYDNTSEEPQNISYKRKQLLNKNDRIQFYIKAETNLVVYLFYIAPDAEVSTLISDSLEAPKEYLFLPDAQSWYEFEDALGTEKFILMVSSERIDTIDKILRKLPKDPTKYTSQLIDEIKRQRRQHSALTSEKLRAIEIAGVARGSGSNEQQAEFIEAYKFYSKTYRFEHHQ